MNRLVKLFVLTLILAPLLISCGVGKTKIAFISKTTSGLELSTTPLTLSLDIGRVEGVIAPQFEKGKQIPVMASFKTQNAGLFAPNFGSAFAVGDAAKTMAGLYDDATPFNWQERVAALEGNPNIDSTLHLVEEPDPGSWLGKDLDDEYRQNKVQPVFFGTDTSLGVKVGWSGMTSAVPDSATAGYRRKEFTLVPITMEINSPTDHQMRASSLIATADAAINASGKPSLDSVYTQYFATGDAATLLAMQHGVRTSMLARFDPNKKLYQDKFNAADKKQITTVRTHVLLNNIKIMYEGLKELQKSQLKTKDTEASKQLAHLDNLFRSLKIPVNFQAASPQITKYTHITNLPIAGVAQPSELGKHQNTNNFSTDFKGIMDYWLELLNSIAAINLVKQEIVRGTVINLQSYQPSIPPAPATATGPAVPLSPTETVLLYKQADLQNTALHGLEKELTTNENIIKAYDYFVSKVKQ